MLSYRKRKKDPVSLAAVFGEMLESRGLSKKYYYDRALSIWSEAAGDEISLYTRPIKVENGNLFISVQNSVIRQEIFFLKSSLIDSVNEKLGRKIISDLVLWG